MFLIGDNLWTTKSVLDAIAVIGFLLTLFSIWFAWWLARRDLEKRIAIAQRETIDRLASVLLQSDVTETGRCLREVRELCRASNWLKALDRCEQANHRIPRFRFLPGIHADDTVLLNEIVDKLRLLINQIEDIMQKQNRTGLTKAKAKDLDDMIAFVGNIEGKLRAASLR